MIVYGNLRPSGALLDDAATLASPVLEASADHRGSNLNATGTRLIQKDHTSRSSDKTGGVEQEMRERRSSPRMAWTITVKLASK